MTPFFRIASIISTVALALTMAVPARAAETKAVQTEARILMGLNHFASDAEKKELQAIIDDKATTAQEAAVATALLHVMHTVPAADKTKLQAIVDDKAAPASVKTLATILLGLTHTASAAEKDKLKALAS